jgi:3'(2'), 5'-bisphosphate nucleotidase
MSEREEPPSPIDPTLIAALTQLALQAGAIILKARAAGVVTRTKADRSPVTTADEAAEAAILDGLGRILPGVAVVSEE